MHLKQLKLAGFKSFVDPTIVPFPSQLVAVVGPNGCGKSNIIDAVRWVMGESHAKNLRGGSMADVIFKGSSHRKPLGQASVELVFDNSMGRLMGQYASYQEIAVKRLVTHDGESSYFLNGTRCRRRDITDIFLGTGAGARGYSIIGQDTISRLIEARPDDLRAYLEEAAGVSKYKERRRETVQRIGQTRENLTRVADIREELGKQLQRLERQAKAAERYTELKQDERLCKAEILALKWLVLETELQQLREQSHQLSLQYEVHQTTKAAYLKENVGLRDDWYALNAENQHVQTEFYQLATEMARLEETIQQRHRDKQRLATDQHNLQQDLQTSLNQLQIDSNALEICEQQSYDLQQTLHVLQEDFLKQQQALKKDEQDEAQWNKAWHDLNGALNQAERDMQIEQVRLQHAQERYQQIQLDFEKNQTEQALIAVDTLSLEIATLQDQQLNFETQKACSADQYQRALEQGLSLRQQLIEIEQKLHRAQDNVQALSVQHATILAAQQAVLNQTNELLPASLHLEYKTRLAEVMTVPDEWLRVCEQVLGDGLHAYVFDSMDEIWETLPSLQGNFAIFVERGTAPDSLAQYPRLSDKISGVMPCWQHALDDIYAADDLAQGLSWLPVLKRHQSIVTLDGFWLGVGWVKVLYLLPPDEAGLLTQQHVLKQLGPQLTASQDEVASLIAARDRMHAQLAKNESEQNDLKQVSMMHNDAFQKGEAAIRHKQQMLSHATNQQQMLLDDYESLQFAMEDCATQRLEIESRWHIAIENTTKMAQQKEQLLAEKLSWEAKLTKSRQQLDAIRNTVHQTELLFDREVTKKQQIQTSIMRETRQVDTLRERIAQLDRQFLQLDEPNIDHSALLSEKIAQHAHLDAQLSQSRQKLSDLQMQLQNTEQLGMQAAQQATGIQELRQQIEIQEQAAVVRASTLMDSITALDVDANTLLASMSTEITVGSGDNSSTDAQRRNLNCQQTLNNREQRLLELNEKIKRLGAINLLAIEEYRIDIQRKEHLDDQYTDLTEALATLEVAMAKMDKETEQRLKDTFDQVNLSFQALFPRLFGGGHAKLELTCGNLLEAGILVMAQPPGKRNTTIHMLSGGEKAMTAVALVFAIFQLNPSPFCMLDEVDAPLDDANVRRFCELVREMSEFVQFLFITHNKVTMELADHLIGVTMREPGVSRVVAVDVEFVVNSVS